jgi:hypothetical protein
MIGPMPKDGNHIEDGDIIRLLDGECGQDEKRSIREHLQDCAQCQHEADELERLSRGFGLLLQRADVMPAPSEATTRRGEKPAVGLMLAPRWTRTRVLKAAAVVALVITAIGVSPARAWLVDGWQAIRSLFTEGSAEPKQPPPPSETATAPAVVTFTPRGPAFTIDVSSAQISGTVSLAMDSGPSASARVLGGDGSEELVVHRGGLHIVNAPTSSARYEIVVPQSISTLELIIAGRTVLSLGAGDLSGLTNREIDLRRER